MADTGRGDADALQDGDCRAAATVNAVAPIEADARMTGKPVDSGRALFWQLFWIYQVACMVAVGVTLFLATLGLEFTFVQWMAFWGSVPLGVAFYNSLDVLVMRHHLKPLAPVLTELDRGGPPPDRERLGAALVRALNLPQLSAVRVMGLHGPAATLALSVLIYVINTYFHVGIAGWQFLWLAATIFLFATPAHAIFEFFVVSRAIEPIAIRLSRVLDGPIPASQARDLIAVPLRNKVLFLAIFCCSLPLVYLAVTFLHKFDRFLDKNHLVAAPGDLQALYLYIGGVVLVCVVGAVSMAILTAREVSHSAARLVDAMRHVESGRLEDADLEILTTDEYADINRGFGLMLGTLREEQQILEVTQDLAGELLLDVLIGRIMHATTQLLNAERATLFVYDEKPDELISIYADNMGTQQIRVPTDRGIAGAVFTTGKVEHITDPYADPRFNPEIDRLTGFVTRSILCVPITNKAGARIGVAQALNKKGALFNAKDEARLKAFAAQIAVSLENAKLFDDVLTTKNYNESILKSTSNGIVTLNTETEVVTANEAAQHMIGLGREEMVGKAAGTLFAGPNGWIAESLAKTQITGETALAMDAELVRGDGSTSSVNLTAMPLIDSTESQIGSMLVLEDLTEEKRIRSTMSRYMSKEVADQLLAAGEAELGGKEQKVTVMFSDVRGFTSIAEALGPRETVSMLNEYFTEMVEAIFQHGGILDKYMGDGIMALFGAPFLGPNDADNALATTDEMMQRLAGLNVRRAANGQEPLDIGIGFSTGPTVIGNIGSVRRLDYTVIGDTVNLASRLEGATKQYDARILLSEMTVRDLKRPATLRELDLIRVKGKDRPVAVYESLGYRAGELGLPALLELHAAGIEAYRARDWKKAARAFEGALELYPSDGPAAVYRTRCQLMIKTPPPDDWDGVWNLTEK